MINKVILIGNLGADPEMRDTANGPVANLRIATSYKTKDQEYTEWHRVVFFGRTAEVCGQYLKKGSRVYVEGSLRTNEWEKDGQKHYTTEVVGRDMKMLSSAGATAPPPSEDVPF